MIRVVSPATNCGDGKVGRFEKKRLCQGKCRCRRIKQKYNKEKRERTRKKKDELMVRVRKIDNGPE